MFRKLEREVKTLKFDLALCKEGVEGKSKHEVSNGSFEYLCNGKKHVSGNIGQEEKGRRLKW